MQKVSTLPVRCVFVCFVWFLQTTVIISLAVPIGFREAGAVCSLWGKNCWLEVSSLCVRNVLLTFHLDTSFLTFSLSSSKFWDCSQFPSYLCMLLTQFPCLNSSKINPLLGMRQFVIPNYAFYHDITISLPLTCVTASVNGGFCLRNVHKLATHVNQQFLFVVTQTSGHWSSPAELPFPKQTYKVLGMPPRFSFSSLDFPTLIHLSQISRVLFEFWTV